MIPPDSTGKELITISILTRHGTLRVFGVETGTPQLRPELRTTSKNHFYEVKLYAGEKLKPGPLKTTIKVKTDDPKYPLLSIPFESVVQ